VTRILHPPVNEDVDAPRDPPRGRQRERLRPLAVVPVDGDVVAQQRRLHRLKRKISLAEGTRERRKAMINLRKNKTRIIIFI
jgi:hypothetical protein